MKKTKMKRLLSVFASAAITIGLVAMPITVGASDGEVLNGTKTDALTVPVDTTYELDLNGHEMTGKIVNNGTLTIKDSKNTGKVSVTGDHVITNKGTLTIEGGTFDALTDGKGTVYNALGATATINGGVFIRSQETGKDATNSGGNSWYVLFNNGTMTINDAKVSSTGHYSSLVENGWFNGSQNKEGTLSVLTINGGTFTGGINTIKNDDYAKVTITNGKFVNSTQGALMNYNIADISGGTFESNSTVIINTKLDDLMDKGELTITGGTFTHTGNGEIIDRNHSYSKGTIGTVSIKSGTFSNDVSKFLDANNYKCVKVGAVYKVAPVVKSVTLSSTNTTLTVGTKLQLKATITPNNTLDKTEWSSNNTSVATVDQEGNVKAIASGNATISVKAGNIEATCVIKVEKLDVVVEVPKVDTTKPVDKVEVGVSDKKSEQALSESTNKVLADIANGKEVSEEYMSTETHNAVKNALESGKEVTSKVEAKTVKEVEVDKKAVEEIKTLVLQSAKENKSDATVVEYLDLSVYLVAGNETLGQMNALSEALTFTVAVPENLIKDGRKFYVVRVHDGVAEKLETVLNEDGTLTFETDKFSTYALVYEEETTEQVTITTPEGDVIQTGDNNTSSSVYIAICGMALVAVGVLVLKKKKEEIINK